MASRITGGGTRQKYRLKLIVADVGRFYDSACEIMRAAASHNRGGKYNDLNLTLSMALLADEINI